jgi:hypothetical protein
VRPGTDIHSNTIEGVFSLIKRGVMGTFHSVSRKHLANYLNEFEFRWNTRKLDDTQRVARAIRQIERQAPSVPRIGRQPAVSPRYGRSGRRTVRGIVVAGVQIVTVLAEQITRLFDDAGAFQVERLCALDVARALVPVSLASIAFAPERDAGGPTPPGSPSADQRQP